MTQQILWQSFHDVDARSSSSALDYQFFMPTTADIPLAGWFESAVLNLRYTLQLNLSFTGSPQKQTFYNPTQYAGGHISVQTNGYVVDDFGLKYERQLYNYDLPPIGIAGSAVALPITLRKTSNSGNEHFFSVSDIKVCGEITNTPPPSPIGYLDGTIPAGAICLKGIPGGMELDQIERRVQDPNYFLPINLDEYFHNFSLQGIIYAGFRLDVAATLYFLWEQSGVAIVPGGIVINGAAPFPVYGHTCAFGQPVPLPLNPPCIPVGVGGNIDPITGQPSAACGGG
jgi:hypothetical protein